MIMRRIASCIVLTSAGTFAASLAAPATAGAAEPVVQACVGQTFSQAASSLPPSGFGTIIVSFAQEPGNRPGIGDGIQDLQAGLIPDSLAPNTCNG